MTTTEIVAELHIALEALSAEHVKTTKVSRDKARSLSLVIKKLAAEFKVSSKIENPPKKKNVE